MVKNLNITNRTKFILGIVISLIVIMMMVYCVKNISAKLTVNLSELNNLKADLVNLDKILNQSKEKKEDIQKVLRSIPQSYDEVSDYAKKIDVLANSLSLSPEIKLDKLENKEANGIKSIKVNIVADGSYPTLIEFIDEITNLPYHTEVDTMKIERKEGVINLNLTYRLFSFVEK